MSGDEILSRSRNDHGKKRGLHGPRIFHRPDRQSVSGPGRKRRRGSLWLGHEIEAARAHHHAGTAAARRATLRRRQQCSDIEKALEGI